MPNTNDVCDRAGTFESECEHGVRIMREEGQVFPQCGPCRAPVEWIRELIPPLGKKKTLSRAQAAEGYCATRQPQRGNISPSSQDPSR